MSLGQNVLDPSTISGASDADPDTLGISIGLRIVFHPDGARLGDVVSLFERGQRGVAVVGRREPTFRDYTGKSTGPLTSAHVSRAPFSIRQGDGGGVVLEPGQASLSVGASKLGSPLCLSAEQVDRGVILGVGDHVVLWLGPTRPTLALDAQGLVGCSETVRRLREEIARVAGLDVSVLLRGETGVGKELTARAIHDEGQRSRGHYVSVNMAAIPASTAVSQLFGHARGAFTGATSDRRGYFAEADGGTLFLDEIGDTPSEIQPMLLRALELGQIQPVGGQLHSVNVRVVAATDSNLEAAIASGNFRWPLLRRFDYQIRIPPLRERREDIGLLFRHFLRRELSAFGEGARLSPVDSDRELWLPARLGMRLACHGWPGNVRELRNFVKRYAIHNRGRERVRVDETLSALLDDASAHPQELAPAPTDSPQADGESPRRTRERAARNLNELTDAAIASAWRRSRFRVREAAAALGVGTTYLSKRLEACAGIRLAKDLDEAVIRAAIVEHGGDLERAAEYLEVSERALKLQMARLRLEG